MAQSACECMPKMEMANEIAVCFPHSIVSNILWNKTKTACNCTECMYAAVSFLFYCSLACVTGRRGRHVCQNNKRKIIPESERQIQHAQHTAHTQKRWETKESN